MLVFSSDARRFASLLRLTSPSVDHGRADCDDAVRCVCLTHIILSLFSLTHDNYLTTNLPNTSLGNSVSRSIFCWSGHLMINAVYNKGLIKDGKIHVAELLSEDFHYSGILTLLLVTLLQISWNVNIIFPFKLQASHSQYWIHDIDPWSWFQGYGLKIQWKM